MLQTCEACGERPASTSGLCAACALSSRPSSGFDPGPDRRAPLLPLLGAAASALALVLGAAYAERLAQGETVADPVAWLKRRRGGTPTLDSFARDLTAAAKTGELDPVIGRDEEIERLVAVLARRTKNNPVLVGEPGVGKTAIVEGLAQRIVRGQVPASLREKRVLALSVGSLVAGTKYRGEMESRVKRILDEVRERSRDVVLFIDELHTLVGAGAAEGALDLSSMIKPELARGDLQCIGATTFDEYRKYIEADAALERRFQPVMVGEPSIDETAAILFGLRRSYEHHHGVVIQDDAVRAAASLSARYIADRRLPDKAIDLMDEAASSAALNSARAVTRADVSAIISKWTGIPQGDVDQEQARGLLDLERALGERVIGQAAAIETVAHAVRRGRTGLKDPRRPLGGFLFVGPSGVGKTELAKALAIVLFGTEDAVVRLDLSEYSQPHSISRLVGAPPGYAGHDEPGQLTEPVRRRPYCVVLLDAFDKTHADVATMLLQILDDGRLTDAKGRAVDFRHAIVILTSNADPEELALTTAPELLNRIDDIVRFDPLDIDSIERIVELQMRGVEERLEDRGITLLLSDAARRHIARESMAAGDGARHVGRTISRLVTTPLSGALLRDEIREGAAARVELLGETIAFLTSPEFAD